MPSREKIKSKLYLVPPVILLASALGSTIWACIQLSPPPSAFSGSDLLRYAALPAGLALAALAWWGFLLRREVVRLHVILLAATGVVMLALLLGSGRRLLYQRACLRNLTPDRDYYHCNFQDADLAGADLANADLTQARMKRVDLSQAMLRGANLSGVDLHGANFSEADLRAAKLEGANLQETYLQLASAQGVNLRQADLRNADLGGANLARARLAGANLHDTNFQACNLEEAELSGLDLRHTSLAGADLSLSDLSSVNLEGVDLSGQDLAGANVSAAQLSGARLENADLLAADLSDAELQGASLQSAVLRGATLDGAAASDLNLENAAAAKATFIGADLDGAMLVGAALTEANFSGASLRDADLSLQVLHGVLLYGADLSSADLHGADLSGVDLSTTMLDGANLDHAKLMGALMAGGTYTNLLLNQADLREADLHGASFEGCDFGQANLSAGNLRGADLSGNDLTGVDFHLASLPGAVLDGADLTGANLQGQDLSQVSLRESQVQDANLREAYFHGCDLRDLDFSGASLQGADLGGANLAGADLRQATLSAANLRGANLEDAFLSGKDLSQFDLRGVNLSGADLSAADLAGMYLLETELRGANLEHANLQGAMLQGLDLRSAALSSANLQDADLRYTDLDNALLDEANLEGALLSFADLHRASGLGQDDFEAASGLVNGTLIDTRQEVIGGLSPVCRGEAVPLATAYQPGAGSRPAMLLSQSGGDHAWSDNLPSAWEPTGVRFAQLVVCVGSQEKYVISSTPYCLGTSYCSNPTYLQRRRYRVEAEIRRAQDGRLLVSQTFYGDSPRAPQRTESWSTVTSGLTGSRVSYSAMKDWLERYIAPRSYRCEDPLGCIDVYPDAPIEIGAILALSGDFESMGIDTLRGMELAAQELGQVAGHPLRVVPMDSRCDEETGADVAEQLAQNAWLLGSVAGTCGYDTYEAAKTMAQHGRVSIAPIASEAWLTADKYRPKGFARVMVNELEQARLVAEFAYQQLGARKMATLHDGQNYGGVLQKHACEVFASLGGTCLAQEQMSPQGTNLPSLVASIGQAQPDVVYFPCLWEMSGLVLEHLRREPGLQDTPLIGSRLVLNQAFLSAFGEDVVGLYISANMRGAEYYSNDYADFLDQYELVYGTTPQGTQHAYGYDSLLLMAEAIERVVVRESDGTLHIPRQALQEALLEVRFVQGLTGTLSCDASGDCGDASTLRILQYLDSNPGSFAPGEEQGANPLVVWP